MISSTNYIPIFVMKRFVGTRNLRISASKVQSQSADQSAKIVKKEQGMESWTVNSVGGESGKSPLYGESANSFILECQR